MGSGVHSHRASGAGGWKCEKRKHQESRGFWLSQPEKRILAVGHSISGERVGVRDEGN